MKSDYTSEEWCNRVYTGVYLDAETCMEEFCSQILSLANKIWAFMGTCRPMNPLTAEQLDDFKFARYCYLCKHPFRGKANQKVRDHDHIMGDYLGAACNACNLKRQRKRWFLPLIFHNAKGYDLHHIIKEITKEKYCCTFQGIPQSSEKILSFTIIPPGQSFTIKGD